MMLVRRTFDHSQRIGMRRLTIQLPD